MLVLFADLYIEISIEIVSFILNVKIQLNFNGNFNGKFAKRQNFGFESFCVDSRSLIRFVLRYGRSCVLSIGKNLTPFGLIYRN